MTRDFSLLRGRVPRGLAASMLVGSLIGCGDSALTDYEDTGLQSEAIDSEDFGAGTAFGAPLSRLTTDELERFDLGKDEFAEVDGLDEGLGPVFNDNSCAACHTTPVVGGSSERTVTRFGRVSNGTFDPLAQFGGSLIQAQGIGQFGNCNFVAEQVPREATNVAKRRTTALFGLGLVDAVPEATIRAISRFQPAAVRGTVSVVTDLETGKPAVGKFGWKCQVPSVHVFAGDAYLNEMGITSKFFPNDNCPQGNCDLLKACYPTPPPPNDEAVDGFADFMAMMGPPPRGPRNFVTLRGRVVFGDVGCATCHTPALRTGREYPIAALRDRTFFPFSDFLLHDMGNLGDGITQNLATGRLMRTAPLWGLRVQKTLLHDGRATTIEQAVLAHDGQGAAAREAFKRLQTDRKAALMSFLQSL